MTMEDTVNREGAGPAPAYVLPTRGWAARRAASVLAGTARDRLRPTKPVAVGDIPHAPGDITPEWLTAVLCAEVPGARVTGVSFPGGSVGTTTRMALALTYNDAGREGGLPERLFVKCTTALMTRMMFGMGKTLSVESGFFNDVRPNIAIEAPRSYYAKADEKTWRSICVMEDVAETRGATFWSTDMRIDRRRADDLVANMAAWHGAYWDSPRLRPLWYLKTPNDQLATIDSMIGMEKRSLAGAERARDVIPAGIRDRQNDLYEGMRRSFEISSREPHTFLHGDSHVGNTYVTAEGAMGYGDWQLCIRGGWQFDYAYIVGTALEVEDRRAWEHDLLAHYLDRLHAAGGPKLNKDEAWKQVREAAFYPYYAWVYTIGRARLQPKFQPDEISLPMIERTAAQIDDLDSLAAIGL